MLLVDPLSSGLPGVVAVPGVLRQTTQPIIRTQTRVLGAGDPFVPFPCNPGFAGDWASRSAGVFSSDPLGELVDGDDPVDGVSLGEDPVDGVSLGEDPVDGVSLGEDPVDGVSLGEDPVDGVSLGEDPVDGVSLGEDPVDGALSQTGKPGSRSPSELLARNTTGTHAPVWLPNSTNPHQ